MIMKKITAKQRGKIQQEIFTWYKTNQRSLPWRTTTDQYAILVSEIMLQQTQINEPSSSTGQDWDIISEHFACKKQQNRLLQRGEGFRKQKKNSASFQVLDRTLLVQCWHLQRIRKFLL